ncbi:hypothetical protein IQ07DRAFT_604316 [Pyrenochaeta sp. DS3sAY3a]|nr:hypothetical protein IQ07DRAFT_604316 [Pyrenochaeta sp. DS3sAY3a]
MPYIICVPSIPRPYITNDSRIYMDCMKAFGWRCESRPFSDSYCKDIRAEEDRRYESERRDQQLERHWREELAKREMMPQDVVESAVRSAERPMTGPESTDSEDDGRSSTTEDSKKHGRHDSV